jgi:poly(A) polymerase
MTIEIDAQRRVESLQAALLGALDELERRDLAPLWVGGAALALCRGLEPSPLSPLVLSVRSEAADVDGTIDSITGLLRYDVKVVNRGPVGAGGPDGDRRCPARVLALAVGPGGVVVDPGGVFDDFASGELVAADDWLTYLRGRAASILEIAGWAAETGLVPNADILRAMTRDCGHLLTVPRRIWRSRLDQILTAPCASIGLQLLLDVRALPLLLHEVTAMVDFHKSCPVHHKDIWDHTLQVIDKCPPIATVRWAALMHDSGKVWTRTVGGRGKVHFFRHEELGASLMTGVAARFEMAPATRDPICYVIANHARANVYSTEWTDTAVRRLIRDMGEHLDAVLAFSRSDFTTKRAWRIREVRELGEELLRRIEAIVENDARVAPLPKGFGTLVMERTGQRGGPWLGEIQRRLEAEVEAGTLPAGEDAEFYFDWVQHHAADLLAVKPAARVLVPSPAPATPSGLVDHALR